jgi:adenylate cyclase class IV
MKNFEVEVRGPLNKNEYDKLNRFLKKNGIFIAHKKRIIVDYTATYGLQTIRNRDKDIRLRCTNGIPEMIIKIGNWGGSEQRKEISLKGKKGEFDKMVEMFGALGFTEGIICIRNILVYNFKNIEFALVEVPNHSYFYEAEIMTTEKDSNEATEYINKICKELNLKIFSADDFYKYVEILNKNVNEKFNFLKYKEGYFEKRFKLSK